MPSRLQLVGSIAIVAVIVVAATSFALVRFGSTQSQSIGTSSSSSSNTGVQTSSTQSSQSSTSGSAVQASTTSTSSIGQLAGNASTVASNGLLLSLSMNATRISVRQDLQVNVSLFNTLSKVNSIASANDWPFNGILVGMWDPCYSTNFSSLTTPVQAVVLKGDYTAANISSVADINFSGYDCYGASMDINQTVFKPNSSYANVTGIAYSLSEENVTLGPYRLSVNFTTSGYWDLLNNSRQIGHPIIGCCQEPPLPPIATVFAPGAYTVAVADEWGQEAILHVVVTS
jgi:hypothetical protein